MSAFTVNEHKKSPNLSVRTIFFLLFPLPFLLVSSAISFRLLPASISAAASSGSPLSSTFVSDFSRLSIPRLPASFPLSDLRCFRFLSSASVLDFDYSASALPFPLLPASASQLPLQCSSLAFAPYVFPVLSSLISRAFLPGSGTQLRCLFPFTLPCFTPTAVPQVLTSSFHFPYFPLPFHFLSSTSVSLPATQPSVSSFRFFLSPPHSCFLSARPPLSLPSSSSFSPA